MTMDNETINLLFRSLLSILGLIITGFLVPYIKTKLGEEKFNQLRECANLYVRTAEMIFTVDEWRAKKEYAYNYVSLKAKELGLELSPDEINAYVESSVNYIKYGTTYTKDSKEG